jgi:uncharacterized protein
LARLARLAPMLAETAGKIDYDLQFGRDVYGCAFLDVSGTGCLPLTCQRTLERYVLPVSVRQRLGLVKDEADEARLPPGYEALLVGDDDNIDPLAALEDELILAVPVVPLAPDNEEQGADGAPWQYSTGELEPEVEVSRPNPFAALHQLKKER